RRRGPGHHPLRGRESRPEHRRPLQVRLRRRVGEPAGASGEPALMATARPQATTASQEKLYRVALREALGEEMERDESVFLIGEDIGKFGGAYRVTEGRLDRSGPRRFSAARTAEEVIVALPSGSPIPGLRP